MSVLATYLILLSGCDRNDLCYDHPHENLHVAVVWDSVPAELQTSLPEGVRISMYAVQQARQEQSGANYTYYRDTYGGDVTVQNGIYNFLLFNSDTEKDTIARHGQYVRRKPIWMPVRVPLIAPVPPLTEISTILQLRMPTCTPVVNC